MAISFAGCVFLSAACNQILGIEDPTDRTDAAGTGGDRGGSDAGMGGRAGGAGGTGGGGTGGGGGGGRGRVTVQGFLGTRGPGTAAGTTYRVRNDGLLFGARVCGAQYCQRGGIAR